MLIGTVAQPSARSRRWAPRLGAAPPAESSITSRRDSAPPTPRRPPRHRPSSPRACRSHVALDVRLYEIRGAQPARDAPLPRGRRGGRPTAATAASVDAALRRRRRRRLRRRAAGVRGGRRGARALSHQFERRRRWSSGRRAFAFAAASSATRQGSWVGRYPPRRSVEPRLPPRGLQLYARGRNLIGEATIAFNVFISHAARSHQPTTRSGTTTGRRRARPARSHAHRRAPRKCCEEAAAREGRRGGLGRRRRAAPTRRRRRRRRSTRPRVRNEADATLWIAFKARAVAASELSFYAKQVSSKVKRARGRQVDRPGRGVRQRAPVMISLRSFVFSPTGGRRRRRRQGVGSARRRAAKRQAARARVRLSNEPMLRFLTQRPVAAAHRRSPRQRHSSGARCRRARHRAPRRAAEARPRGPSSWRGAEAQHCVCGGVRRSALGESERSCCGQSAGAGGSAGERAL